MEDNKLQEQLYRFLKGEESSGEGCDSGNKEWQKALRQLDELTAEPCCPDKQRMWGKVYRHVVSSRRKRMLRRWSAVAAVLVPAVLVPVLFLYFGRNRYAEPEVVQVAGNRQVELLLNDGRVIEVQGIGKDSVLVEKGAGILLDTSRCIVYTARQDGSRVLVYNTLRVPRCCEYHLVLADGTQVWMNSESELRFPVDFVGQERRVFLKGEAYFQVAKDTGKPFRVEAGEMQVEALGTGFDVNAYRDGDRYMATLVEGRVRVSRGQTEGGQVLNPGEQAILQGGELSIAKVNTEDVTGWKEGRFVFSNMTLEEISKQLERWYDVEINFQDAQVSAYRFTGVMKRYNSLSQLIVLVEETTNVKFQVNGRNVLICRR